MRIVVWVLRALVFFALFALALNNQHPALVHGFFGVSWTAPMIIVLLVVFAAGCAVGVLVMLPGWWRHRLAARRADRGNPTAVPKPPMAASPVASAASSAGALVTVHPPRDGL